MQAGRAAVDGWRGMATAPRRRCRHGRGACRQAARRWCHEQNAPCGASLRVAERVGWTRAIHGPRRATRGGLRPSGSAVLPIRRTLGSPNVHSLRHTQNAPCGAFRVWRREWDGLGPSMALAARRAAACGRPDRQSCRSVEPWALPTSTLSAIRKTPLAGRFVCGGESGIRTHGRLAPAAVFKTAALNRSAISPGMVAALRAGLIDGAIVSCVRGGRLARGVRVTGAGGAATGAVFAIQAGGLDQRRQAFGQEIDEHSHRRQQAAA